MNIRLLCLLASVSAAGCDAQTLPRDPSPRTDPPPSTRDLPTTTGAPAVATQPDNTARNERDRGDATLTPMDQSQSAADVEITAEIRRAILADRAMAVDASNVKIITMEGAVTLRGPVAGAAERSGVEAKARAVPGVTRVDNQLEITSP